MKSLYLLSGLFHGMVIALLTACSSPQGPALENEPTVISILKPKWARGFEIHYMSDSSLHILLFNLEKTGDTLQVLHWRPHPVDRVACLSTTHIAMLEKLGKLDALKGVGFADLVQNPSAKEKITRKEIINLTSSHDVDAEIVFSVSPQLFFIYPFGGMNYERYEEKNIPCIPISEYLETHPLGRAEWIRVFGALMDEDAEAARVFAAIESKYLDLNERGKESSIPAPTVFTGFYDSGTWFAPPGNSFAARFIQDAGAHYIFSDSTGSSNIAIPFETMLDATMNTDWWGKIVFSTGPVDLNRIAEDDVRLTKLSSFRNGRIFYCNTAEADYHGDALMEPEIMLADLIAVFHPDVLPQHQPVYFHRLGNP